MSSVGTFLQDKTCAIVLFTVRIFVAAQGDESYLVISSPLALTHFSVLTLQQQATLVTDMILSVVKLRQGSGKDWQGMALKAKGLKA